MLTDARRDPTIAWGLLLAFAAAVLRIRPLGAPDTWWHLNVGRIVLETGQRRFPDRMAIEVKEQFVAGEWDNESDENVIESLTLTFDFFELVQ